MPATEKNGVVAIVTSKVADEEAPVPVQAHVEALKESAIPVQTPVPAFAIAAGEEAPAILLQILQCWDPYGDINYIRPENPFDASLADLWSEVDSSDDESTDTKTRQVLRKLKSGQFNGFFVGNVYRCPFCTRGLTTDFNSHVRHSEDMKTCGLSKNIHAFRAKHQALGCHLHNLQKVSIDEGRMPPIKPKPPKVKGLGNKKWRKRQREEAEALLVEAMRGH